LSFLKDKAGKTRVVAIFDLYSQSVLKPIHDYIGEILSTLPTDGTYDQEAQRVRVQDATRAGKKCYSFDLKSATDRLPVELSEIVLSQILASADIASAWREVMVNRDFHFGKPIWERRPDTKR